MSSNDPEPAEEEQSDRNPGTGLVIGPAIGAGLGVSFEAGASRGEF